MSNNNAIPIVGLENNIASEPQEPEIDERDRVKDPDTNADEVESAEADRLAVEPDDEPDDRP
jgi:hypothetical protein